MRFVDTDVLLYSVSTTPVEALKARRAREVLAQKDLVVSAQVLGEFYVQATRASRDDALTHSQAARLVESFTRFTVQPLTLSVVLAALHTEGRHHVSYWDAAIIEAAREAGCVEVLTEDLNDGQDFDGVVIQNPFAPTA